VPPPVQHITVFATVVFYWKRNDDAAIFCFVVQENGTNIRVSECMIEM